jgi:hypothetical protein
MIALRQRRADTFNDLGDDPLDDVRNVLSAVRIPKSAKAEPDPIYELELKECIEDYHLDFVKMLVRENRMNAYYKQAGAVLYKKDNLHYMAALRRLKRLKGVP